VRLWPLRDFADEWGRRVDDRPFGGGPGMVMMAQPLIKALDAIAADRGEARPAVVHFSPGGQRIDQALVQTWACSQGAILLCGRYEGIDQRLLEARVTHELSLGDFVLSGGELPALALLDAVARLQQGVISPPSHEQDSFGDGLLEGPHYTRPEALVIDDQPRPVPAALLSGHHGEIARWRRERSLEITARRRPDLILAARLAGRLSAADEQFLSRNGL
jgi:tRNA (guanine37-N1)-methyltransferase